MSIAPRKIQLQKQRSSSSVNFTTAFINKLPRSVGVEYDFDMSPEKVELFKCFSPLFNIGSDDHRELRSIPAKGDQLITTLVAVANLAKMSGVKSTYINYGYHVHVDGLDLGTAAVLRVLYAWQYAEKYIWKQVVDRTRQKTNFAIKLTPLVSSTYPAITGLKSFCTTQEIERMINTIFTDCRFELNRHAWWVQKLGQYSIYICQLYDLGTIEFRIKEATGAQGPFEDLLVWPLFCGWFVEVLSDMDDRVLIKYLPHDYKSERNKIKHFNNFLREFFPEFVYNWFINHGSI